MITRNCYRRFFSVFVVSVVVLVTNAKAQEISEREPGLWVTRELQSQLSSIRTHQLRIRSASSLSGDLKVTTWNQSGIGISYTKQSRTRGRERALDHIDLIAVILDSVGGSARLEFRAPNPPPWDNKTEFGLVHATVRVPEGCAVEIEAQRFNVEVIGPVAAVQIPSSLGRITITKVTELLDITTANGRIDLTEIAGEMNVSTSNASITARDLKADKVRANFRNESGEIQITGFQGSINARNNYGKIEIQDFRPSGETNFIRCASGQVILGIVELTGSQLVVDNKAEDIDISIPDSSSAFISLSVDDQGIIDAANFPFRTDLVQKNRLNLITGDGTADINAAVKGNGRIFVHTKSVKEGP